MVMTTLELTHPGPQRRDAIVRDAEEVDLVDPHAPSGGFKPHLGVLVCLYTKLWRPQCRPRPGANGILTGLRSVVTREQLARAATEGVACGLLDGLDALAAHAPTGAQLIAVGEVPAHARISRLSPTSAHDTSSAPTLKNKSRPAPACDRRRRHQQPSSRHRRRLAGLFAA
jgi:hypothetical protein